MPPGYASRACDLRKQRRLRLGQGPVPGPGCGSRIARRPPRDSAATASAAAGSCRLARNLAPMTLATELNPHKPELNPHGVKGPAAGPARTSSMPGALSAAGRQPGPPPATTAPGAASQQPHHGARHQPVTLARRHRLPRPPARYPAVPASRADLAAGLQYALIWLTADRVFRWIVSRRLWSVGD